MNVSKASLKKLISLAVKAEIEANRIYSRMAGRVKNELLKEKFSVLALEEKKHENILKRLFKSLYPKERFTLPLKTEKPLLPKVHLKPSSTLADILYQAMESEKAAQEFYARLSKRFQDKKKKILEYLSKVERGHYLMLHSEYVLALQFEDYAEKDIDRVVT